MPTETILLDEVLGELRGPRLANFAELRKAKQRVREHLAGLALLGMKPAENTPLIPTQRQE